MTAVKTSGELPQAFPQTRWSVVLAAKRDTTVASTAALEAICNAYWYPLYAFARRCGHAPHDAEDITQEFFCRLLEKKWLDSADKEKGRLRTFLVVALKRFMANEWRRASAQRRGGGLAHVPMDSQFAETKFAAEASSILSTEDIFDQQWALTLLDLTFERLRKEFDAAGKPRDFDVLKNCLIAERGGIDYAGIASELNLNEGAARVAVHRLRKRFREIYREEIAQTLSEGADLESEVRQMAQALART